VCNKYTISCHTTNTTFRANCPARAQYVGRSKGFRESDRWQANEAEQINKIRLELNTMPLIALVLPPDFVIHTYRKEAPKKKPSVVLEFIKALCKMFIDGAISVFKPAKR
jgi:hypothetical protein